MQALPQVICNLQIDCGLQVLPLFPKPGASEEHMFGVLDTGRALWESSCLNL